MIGPTTTFSELRSEIPRIAYEHNGSLIPAPSCQGNLWQKTGSAFVLNRISIASRTWINKIQINESIFWHLGQAAAPMLSGTAMKRMVERTYLWFEVIGQSCCYSRITDLKMKHTACRYILRWTLCLWLHGHFQSTIQAFYDSRPIPLSAVSNRKVLSTEHRGMKTNVFHRSDEHPSDCSSPLDQSIYSTSTILRTPFLVPINFVASSIPITFL